MSIRKLLVSITGREEGDAVLNAAAVLLQRFQATADVLCVATDPASIVPMLGDPSAAVAVERVMQDAEADSARRLARGRGLFDAWRARHGLPLAEGTPEPGSVRWLETIGDEPNLVAQHGRVADIIVVGGGSDDDGGTIPTVETTLLESGRPTLYVPQGAASNLEHVLIAWNDTADASRAVALAMPLIDKARDVTIVTIREGGDEATSAPDLAAYLATHGIAAAVEDIGADDPGEAILAVAARCGAGLLVMGAYSHSRLREMILGGATRYVLQNATIPVLMAH